MKLYTIQISTIENLDKTEEWRKNWLIENKSETEVQIHDKKIFDREKKRNKFKELFPFTVIISGVYPDHDFLSFWCWQNIGPMQCDVCIDSCSQYPGCPLVLATEYIETSWYENKAGQREYWSEKAYIEEKVPEHGHEGVWLTYWLGKTGYDYGFSEYYFKNESDRDKFIAAIPILTSGEQKEKGEEMSVVTEKTVYQSKWGYHPVSFETSKKLRFINEVYAQALHQAGAWERWERKRPQNRVIKRTIRDSTGLKIGKEVVMDDNGNPLPWREPKINSLFHEKVPGHVKWGGYIRGVAKDNGFGEKVLFASRQARIPQKTAEDVKSFPFTEAEIDRLYELVKNS